MENKNLKKRFKKPLLTFITIALLSSNATVKAQNQEHVQPSVEKSVFGAQAGLLGIWVNNEAKLTNAIALRSEIGFDGGFWGGSSCSSRQASAFRSPAMITRSGSAPAAMKCVRSCSSVVRIACAFPRTRRKKNEKSEYRRAAASSMRPPAMQSGIPRLLDAKKRFGQISVSSTTTTAGRIRRRTRRITDR